jgi:hypothetical protein
MSNVPTRPFWMIYGIGQCQPTVMHQTRHAADYEAKRLARANPDTCFVVLESVAAVVKRDVDVITIRGREEDDGIPF